MLSCWVEMLRFVFYSWVLECGRDSSYQMSGESVQGYKHFRGLCIFLSLSACWCPPTVPLP